MGKFKQFVRRALRRPANLLVSSSTNLPLTIPPILMEVPAMAAKFVPYQGSMPDYILDPISESVTSANKGLPVPPQELWQGYGGSTEEYLRWAGIHVKAMKDVLDQSDFPIQAGYRILDLGCGTGRMIREFEDIAGQCEIWGVDIVAEFINWCQRHMSPPFHFATTTTFPHLPFEDRYFDFIYCGSIFTHIADLGDAWLLELRRVTRPNGRIYITLHDNNTMKILREDPQRQPQLTDVLKAFERTTDLTDRKFSVIALNRGPWSQVFYDIDYVRQHWSHLFRICSITQEAYSHQTAVLLER
jgi:SAM-dependent methyltransferase